MKTIVLKTFLTAGALAGVAALSGCCAPNPPASSPVAVAASDLPPNAPGVNIVYGGLPVIDPGAKDFTEILVCGAYPKEVLQNIRVLSVAKGPPEGSSVHTVTFQLYNAGNSTVNMLFDVHELGDDGFGYPDGSGSMSLAPHEADLFSARFNEGMKDRLIVVVQGNGLSSGSKSR